MPTRVMLVEDDPALLLALRDALQVKFPAASVSVASSAEDALTLLNTSGPFDAVLSDVRLSGLNGMDLLREVKARFPGCAVLLMTGCEPEKRVEALRLGAASFLEKPVDMDRIAGVMSRAVDQARLLNALHERNRQSNLGENP